MSNSNKNSTGTASYVYPAVEFSYTVRFWLHLVPNIVSILCSIFVLYHLLSDRNLRRTLNNHIFIILLLLGLFYELTEILWIIHYYHFGFTTIQTSGFALIWALIDYSVFECQLILFAWATIERHILVFHDRWVATKKKRFLSIIHLSSQLLCIVSGIILLFFSFHFAQIFLIYSELYGLSSVHCIYKNPIIPKWGIIFHGIIPTLIIIFFSLGLLVRVLWRKSRLNQSINWRKQRKMIIQLLFISIIYLVLYAPYILICMAYNTDLSRKIGAEFTVYLILFSYYITFIFPFVTCISLPQVTIKIKNLFFCQRQKRLIHPRR